MLVALYALTMFASAALLFVVQPMVAKLLLPSLGGSPGVWTTCMLFFQAVLLAGYAYAHLGARLLSPRRQAMLHLPLTVAAFVVLPISIPELGIDASQNPTTWLIAALILAVGLPFFVVSTSAPLLQHWFAHTHHPDRDDPYHLYAASNLGSMTSLLGYPFLIEPFLGVRAQTVAWAVVYAVFVVVVFACATTMRGARTTRATSASRADAAPLSWRQRLRWTVWAFVPSSLMLGVTQYISTDIAAVPLLWVLPLALYLSTFILVFSKRRVLLHDAFRHLLPLLAMGVLVTATFKAPIWIGIVLHLANFFLLAMFFHGELARERPHPSHLTEFFLILSIGGALGGLFNAVIAPLVLDRTLDYHLVLAAAVALIAPSRWRLLNTHGNRWVVPSVVVPICAYFLYAHDVWSLETPSSLFGLLLLVGPVYVTAVLWPRLENPGIGIVILFGSLSYLQTDGIIAYERSFFAAYKVFEREYEGNRVRKVSHGSTTHGSQFADPDKAATPLSYYHREGPVGQILSTFAHRDLLVVGLGAGAMSAYAGGGVTMDIFEIDPLVEELAREHFTYLSLCGEHCTVAIGDGRRLVEEAPDEKWDIIFLDAYNSDSIPTHLMTREALDLYFRKVKAHGLVVFHVSNRYLDLEGVVGALAWDGDYASVSRLHSPPKTDRRIKQVDISRYTVVARDEADLGPLAEDPDWEPTKVAEVLWTDDFTNIVSVFDWD